MMSWICSMILVVLAKNVTMAIRDITARTGVVSLGLSSFQ